MPCIREPGQSKIDQAGVAVIIDQHVLRLDITMDNTVAMRVGHHSRNTGDQSGRFSWRWSAAAKLLFQVATGHVLQNKVRLCA